MGTGDPWGPPAVPAQAPGAQPGRGGAGPPSVLSPSGLGAGLREAGRPPYLHNQDAHPHRAEHVFIVIKPHLHLLVAALGSEDHTASGAGVTPSAPLPLPPAPVLLPSSISPRGSAYKAPPHGPRPHSPPTSDAPRCGPRSPTAHLPSGFRPVHPRPSHIKPPRWWPGPPSPGCPPHGPLWWGGVQPYRPPHGGAAVAPTALGVLHAAAVGNRVLPQHRVPVCVVGDTTAPHLQGEGPRVRGATPGVPVGLPLSLGPQGSCRMGFSLLVPSLGLSRAQGRK